MSEPILTELVAARDAIKAWLLEDAYPLWWEAGWDHARGGFQEKLDLQGQPVDLPRRARVQPRQIYAYAVAGELGWSGPHEQVISQGLDWYLEYYTRPDGLFRTLVAADGAALDESIALYDQAFGLFALAVAYQALGQPPELARRAESNLRVIKGLLAHPAGGFREPAPGPTAFVSNPHMHLFEACLEWAGAHDPDLAWRRQADAIAELALTRFIDPRSGGVREFFDADWRPAPGIDGRIVEPGHQFEWGWLLLRWSALSGRTDAEAAARRMIAIGEKPGVDKDRGVAINQLLDDLSVHDAQARLWPQTERIKAACLLAQTTGDPAYYRGAIEGVRGLMLYFDTPVRGLWRDRLNLDGSFVQEAAPASSFYHIVCAILELDRTVRAL